MKKTLMRMALAAVTREVAKRGGAQAVASSLAREMSRARAGGSARGAGGLVGRLARAAAKRL